MRLRVAALLLLSAAYHQQVLAQVIADAPKDPVTDTLRDPTPDIYPSTNWLPDPYKNECFDKGIDWETAISYCKAQDNNPCATYACPTKEPTND